MCHDSLHPDPQRTSQLCLSNKKNFLKISFTGCNAQYFIRPVTKITWEELRRLFIGPVDSFVSAGVLLNFKPFFVCFFKNLWFETMFNPKLMNAEANYPTERVGHVKRFRKSAIETKTFISQTVFPWFMRFSAFCQTTSLASECDPILTHHQPLLGA